MSVSVWIGEALSLIRRLISTVSFGADRSRSLGGAGPALALPRITGPVATEAERTATTNAGPVVAANGPWRPRTRLVFCFGLYSSASTWLFNLVIALLESQDPGTTVTRFYADTLEGVAKQMPGTGIAVIKSHSPDPALILLARLTGGPTFLTIRDPRDAVKSLTERFSKSFQAAFDQVIRSAAALQAVDTIEGRVLLRFEDRFFDDPATVRPIAEALGLARDIKAGAIFDALTRSKVAARIARLAEEGTFGDDRDPRRFEAETHWHYRHAGNAEIGSHRGTFSEEQVGRIALASCAFGLTFGYDLTPLLGKAGLLTFGPGEQGRLVLVSGFTDPGLEQVWTEGQRAEIRLRFAEQPSDTVSLRFDLTAFTAAEPAKTLNCRIAAAGKERLRAPNKTPV